MYHQGSRELQDRFASRALADRLEETLRRERFNDADKAFVEASPFFFLATADAEGQPDCSFKGGLPGFVAHRRAGPLEFPDYDGNGMFRSLGNIRVNPKVGLLFLRVGDRPGRLRVNGSAEIVFDDPATGGLRRRPDAGEGDPHRHLPQLPALHPAPGDD